MQREKELLILSYFRNDARISLTKLSKMTRMPVSTIFDKLREYKQSKVIKKHTSLLDFRKLGYEIRTQILISSGKDTREQLQKFLVQHPKINNVFRINNGFDFLVESIFRNMEELDEFMRALEEFSPLQRKEFFVMEDLKREEFLVNSSAIGLLR
ncbi:MAG: Lrp/AsnC family transcriptional regulator [Candidatus Nanoarchaeia archaeon]